MEALIGKNGSGETSAKALMIIGKRLAIFCCLDSLNTDFVLGTINAQGSSLGLLWTGAADRHFCFIPFFQTMSYIIDVYWGNRRRSDFIAFAAYVTLFPAVDRQGPIVRCGDVALCWFGRKTSHVNRLEQRPPRFIIGLQEAYFWQIRYVI